MGEKFIRKAAAPEVINRSSPGVDAGSHAPPREDGEDYQTLICVAPEYGEQVYDHYNGCLAGAQERVFAEHLVLCARCRDVILKLKWIDATLATELRAEKGSEPPPAQSAEDGWGEKACGNVF